MAWTLSIDIDPQRWADIVTSAFESGNHGARYWLYNMKPEKGWAKFDKHGARKSLPWYCNGDYWASGIETEFMECTNERTGKTVAHKIGSEQIAKALAVVAAKRPDLLQYLVGKSGSDIADIADGPISDVIIQLVVLGEERYG